MKLRVFNILKSTKVEGPGTRYCIWVQGCSKHCPGCHAEHTWEHSGGTLYDINEIITDILKNIDNIEGVTFSGGEPFEQARALGQIAHICKRHADLGVVCYTGYTIEELMQNPKNTKLLRNTDLLIDGAFEYEYLDYSRPWCGSANQRYHFLSKRYNDEIFTNYTNKVEVNIMPNGCVFLNGMGDFEEVMQSIDLYGTNNWYDYENSTGYDSLGYGESGYYDGYNYEYNDEYDNYDDEYYYDGQDGYEDNNYGEYDYNYNDENYDNGGYSNQ